MPANEEKLQEFYVEISARLNKLEAGMNKAEGLSKSSVKRMNEHFKQVGTTLGVGFGAVQFLNFLKSSIEAAGQQEIAEKKLEVALGRKNRALIENASALQRTTTFADENIIEAQAMIAMFVKEESQIKKLTQASMDLAAAKGMDLVQAADLVAKSIAGEVNALGRYGIRVEGAAGSTERIEMLVRNLNSAFGGQAAAQLDTYTGRLKNMQNQMNDLQEQIGNGILPTLTEMTDSFNKQITTINGSNGLTQAIDKYLKLLFLIPRKVTLPFLGKTFNLFGGGEEKLPEMMPAHGQKIVKPVKTLTDEEKKALEDLKAKQAEFYNAVTFMSEKYYSWKLKEIEKEKNEFIKAGISKADAEAKAQKDIFDLELKRFKNFEDIKPEGLDNIPVSFDVPELVTLSAKTLEIIEENYKNRLDLETDYQKKLSEMREESQITSLEMMDATHRAMQDGFEEAFSNMVRIETQSKNVLIQGFVAMANSFVAEVQRMIAQWISFQIVKGILGAIFAPATGGASAVAAAATMHKGGTVVNSGGRIAIGPGFASGTDFVVPHGYPNDSYPIRVESGERVTVTPANRVADSMGGFTSGGVSEIVTAIKAMNMNLIKKKLSVNITSKVDGLTFYEGKVAPAKNRSDRTGKRINGV